MINFYFLMFITTVQITRITLLKKYFNQKKNSEKKIYLKNKVRLGP